MVAYQRSIHLRPGVPFARRVWEKMPEIEYIEDSMETQELLDSLSPPVRNWFMDKFPDFTEPQKIAIPRIKRGEPLLLC